MRGAPLIALAAVLALSACKPEPLTDTQKAVVKTLSLAALPPLLPDPSNSVADRPEAAALGRDFFNDTGFSRGGFVACASCHVAERQFQDDLALGHGVGVTNRRTMPLAGAAWAPFLFWDGRKDSLWSQALGPVESQVEHGTTRVAVARRVAATYGERYVALFGPLPDLSALPDSAGPAGRPEEQEAWQAMGEADRDAVNRVFANFGKAIEAFERTLPVAETRFDRFAAAIAKGKTPEGDAAFSDVEIDGLKLFIGKGRCINCHNGPRLTDDHFHNTGIPPADGLPEDHGRAAGVGLLDADPFNCLGAYSDAGANDCGELKYMLRDSESLERAFKPPSLRGAAKRPPYMHAGQLPTLEAVIDHYSAAPPAPSGHSELEPANFTDAEKTALIAFLKTLAE